MTRRKPGPKSPASGARDTYQVRLSPETVAKVDAARGLVPRGTWLRDIIEREVARG